MPEDNLPETIRLVNGERVIVPVKYQIGDEVVDAIIARDLWGWLRSNTDYSTWFARRITEAQLIENVDYSLLPFGGEQTGRGGRNRKDYAVTIDTAMHIAMLEQTARGREIRQDLIDWKKKAKAMMRARPAINVRDQGQLAEIAVQLIELNKELKEEVAGLKPDAESMQMLRAADGAVTMTAVAKMLEIKRPWLFDIMTEAGWFYIQNGTHMPYAPLLKQGLLCMGPAKKEPILRTDGRVQIVAATLVTAKGLAKITEIVKERLTEDEQERDEDDAMMERLNHDDRIYGSGD